MPSPAAITAIRPTHRGELIAHEMFATGASMSTSAEDPDLVNKIAFLHWP